MPSYFYTAKSSDGETKAGTLYADDERQLAQILKKEGAVLIRAVNEEEKTKSKFNLSLPFSGVSLTEKIMMVRNLEVMFSAGLPLLKSLDVLMIQAKNKKIKRVLADIKEKVSKGNNLSESLIGYPNIFSELFVNMIKVGEESGTLDESFRILSLQLSREHELKSKIKNAMIYPTIILLVMVIVGIVMIVFVFPSLNLFFTTLAVDIPIYTRIMLNVGNFLSEKWYLLILAPVLLSIFIFLTLKNKKGKKLIDGFLLKLPIISPIVKKSNSAFLVRCLSSLMVSGVALTRSLEISSETVSNHYFKEALIEAGKKIKKGEKLSDALKPYQSLFPIGVTEMIEVGEETGKTSDILKKLANFYEQEAVNSIEKLTIMMEPILIIVLGLGVGLFAFSIIQPMYSSLESINQ